MITVTVTILTVFFAIGSVSPLLLADDVEEVVEVEQVTTTEQ